ncbi:MAG: sterol desaturase family protein [Pseudomonadota bacterium]
MVDFLNKIAEFYGSSHLIGLFIMPAIFSLIGYFVFRNAKELSQHAIQNTAATIILVALNYGAMVLFAADINRFAQRVYADMGIPTLPASFWADTPMWLICVVGIVARDFADYWNHRLMHTKWGWPTHAAHHSDTHVNAFTTYRVHIFEWLVMNFSYILILTWMQIPEAIPAVLMFAHLHNLYVHMDLPFEHGPLKYLVASPVYHRWHHADVPEAYGKNLANVIPAWDVMFGTYYYPGRCNEEMGALKTGVDDKNPFLIFVYPLLEWARLIKASFASPRPNKPESPENVSKGAST